MFFDRFLAWIKRGNAVERTVSLKVTACQKFNHTTERVRQFLRRCKPNFFFQLDEKGAVVYGKVSHDDFFDQNEVKTGEGYSLTLFKIPPEILGEKPLQISGTYDPRQRTLRLSFMKKE